MSLPGTGMSGRVSIRSATARKIAAASVRVVSAVVMVVMEDASFEGQRGRRIARRLCAGPALVWGGVRRADADGEVDPLPRLTAVRVGAIWPGEDFHGPQAAQDRGQHVEAERRARERDLHDTRHPPGQCATGGGG